uniref:Mitoguardin n=1 Tax=Globodera pallida TaxID=36090 RepID=A0A183BSG2_GLOPA
MSELLSIVQNQPRRALIIGAGIGASVFAVQALWRYFFTERSGKKLPRLRNEKWKLSGRCEIDISSLNAAIDSLELLLAELEPNKFQSEFGRGKYDLVASIIARLRGVYSDLQKYVSDDFLKRVSTEDIARSVWHTKSIVGSRTGGAGTLSVLSDSSFISACDEFVAAQQAPTQSENRQPSLSIDQSAIPLYNQGLQMAQRGEVRFRKTRAEFCACESDEDFAAKLYGVRLAFRQIMDEPQTMQWLIQSGRIIIADLLRHDKRDPTEFFSVYDRMTAFLLDDKNFATLCEELKMRKVESTNLWDVLFDLIILDAFEDLQKPPSSISALLRNGYISTSMKESTLNNLIWSMIKLKRQRLQVKNGFIAHFYDISQVLTCSLTMGLIGGSPKEFQELCVYFKEQIFAFVLDIFNPSKVRYTTIGQLTEDVKKLLTDRIDLLKVKLSNELLPI